MKNIFNYRTLVLLLVMFFVIALRVIAPLSPDFKLIAGFSGVGAVAIFGGAYFKNRFQAFIMPLLVLFFSDLGLILTMGADYGFYQGWYYTYIAFFFMIAAGYFIIRKITVSRIILASFAGVFLHWIISDFGVWYGSSMYPQTAGGFWACLVKAIPHERNFLFATLGYSVFMFGIFETLKSKYSVLREAIAFEG